jgi:hypothetical protein
VVAAHAPLGMATARANQPLRVAIPFQPEEAEAVVQELGTWEVNQAVIVPHPAPWLHMSREII